MRTFLLMTEIYSLNIHCFLKKLTGTSEELVRKKYLEFLLISSLIDH